MLPSQRDEAVAQAPDPLLAQLLQTKTKASC